MEHFTGVEGSRRSILNREVGSRPAHRTSTARDSAEFEESRSCAMALAETPAVRAEAVARGRALVADPNYPNAEHINAIARLLARSL